MNAILANLRARPIRVAGAVAAVALGVLMVTTHGYNRDQGQLGAFLAAAGLFLLVWCTLVGPKPAAP